jgi:glucose-6-phosphate 1-dehydrogenase
MADWDDEHWRRRVRDSGRPAPGAGGVFGSGRDVLRAPARDHREGVPALADVPLEEGTRLVLEKPFGIDESSARRLNELLARLLPEDRSVIQTRSPDPEDFQRGGRRVRLRHAPS